MSKAFSPGSVTLFFEIMDNANKLKAGSRGVGVCVSLGAVTSVEQGEELRIYVNGIERKDSIQEDVAKLYEFKGTIKTNLQLPVSQGFGMSAAAALSTSLAIGKIMGGTYLKAAQIAHVVEVERKSGLGDVASQYEGGFTLRIREGIEPYGSVDRLFYPSIPLTLVVFDEKIETKSILQDEKMRHMIKKEGHRAMDRFLQNPNIENAIKIAREFSIRTSMISEEGKNLLSNCPNAAIPMIGNSAIVFGNCKEEILEDYRKYHVTISDRARLLP